MTEKEQSGLRRALNNMAWNDGDKFKDLSILMKIWVVFFFGIILIVFGGIVIKTIFLLFSPFFS